MLLMQHTAMQPQHGCPRAYTRHGYGWVLGGGDAYPPACTAMPGKTSCRMAKRRLISWTSMSAAWKEYVPLPCDRDSVQGAQR